MSKARPTHGRRAEGFTLIEITLLLCVLGVFLAVFVPTFVSTLRTSKISEASRQLSLIHKRAAAYYSTPQPTESGKRLRCLPASAGPTPAEPSQDPREVVFGAPETPGHGTWSAIGHEPGEPIRYRYTLSSATPGCGAPSPTHKGETVLTLRAEGDLDGDGILSLFERSATAADGELVPNPLLVVTDRVE